MDAVCYVSLVQEAVSMVQEERALSMHKKSLTTRLGRWRRLVTGALTRYRILSMYSSSAGPPPRSPVKAASAGMGTSQTTESTKATPSAAVPATFDAATGDGSTEESAHVKGKRKQCNVKVNNSNTRTISAPSVRAFATASSSAAAAGVCMLHNFLVLSTEEDGTSRKQCTLCGVKVQFEEI